jgi:hypothetical protein
VAGKLRPKLEEEFSWLSRYPGAKSTTNRGERREKIAELAKSMPGSGFLLTA